MNFNIFNKLSLLVAFLSCSLDIIVKTFGKDDFKYLSQKFDSSVLDLVRQKGFYPYEYMSVFENFKEKLPNKKKPCSSLTGKKN